MKKLFGTDGIRAIAGSVLTPQLCLTVGRAAASLFPCRKPLRILLGRDTRISGDMVEAALIAGITAQGATAIPVGVVPTPALAYLTRSASADLGIMISASHNPMAYNGIKFFDSHGYKLSPAQEAEIEQMVQGNLPLLPLQDGEKIGRVEPPPPLSDYMAHLIGTVNIPLQGITALVDCGNGAAVATAPAVLRQLGVSCTLLHNLPDGKNINHRCGSTHIEELARLVPLLHAQVGIAFDGDADRLIAVDEQGTPLDGDRLLAIFAKFLLDEGRLPHHSIVATVMSNGGLFRMAEQQGITVHITDVGDRSVQAAMAKTGSVLGGEGSGHLIFADHHTTGDGLLAALQLLSIMKRTGKPLSQLAAVMEPLPQITESIPVPAELKTQLLQDPSVQSAIHQVEKQLHDIGRVLVRPSGTEPVVRIMAEGPDNSLLRQQIAPIVQALQVLSPTVPSPP